MGYLAVDRGGRVEDWRLVFWLAFGIFHVTNIVYIIWASGDIQEWNDGVTGVKPLNIKWFNKFRKSKNMKDNESISEESENSMEFKDKSKDGKMEKLR